MKDIELQISQFIDNELNDEEQKKLFAVLAEDQNARQTLSDFMQLKNDTSEHYKNITTELSSPTINEVITDPNKKYKMMFYFSLAASIVLAMLLMWNQKDKNELLKQYNSLQTHYKNVEKQYLFALKAPEAMKQNNVQIQTSLRKKTLTKPKKAIINGNISIASNQISIQVERLNKFLDNMPAAKISKEDFLIPQMIGN